MVYSWIMVEAYIHWSQFSPIFIDTTGDAIAPVALIDKANKEVHGKLVKVHTTYAVMAQHGGMPANVFELHHGLPSPFLNRD